MDNSDNIYKSMMDHIEDYAILHLDINGNIIKWNKGAEKIKGYSAGEILGKNFRIFYTDPDQKNGLPENVLKEAAQHGKHQEEGWRVRKDGTIFWGSILITAHYDDQQRVTGFTKITHDLTDKRRLEQELRTLNAQLEAKIGSRENELRVNEEKYRHLFASNPLPMWLFDPQTFRFLDVNDIACEHYGFSRQEFLSMTVLDIRDEKHQQGFIASDHPTNLPTQNYHRGTWQHRKKDGTRIEVEIFAHDITFMGQNARMIVAKDVTKQKLAEDKLKHNQVKLEQAQQVAHFGHWELSFATGKAHWSAEACRIYGLAECDNQQLYESWLSFIHPDDLDEVIRETELAQQNFAPAEFYHRIVLRDGSIKYLFSQSHYEFDENGKPIGMYGVAHDVTEQKIAEQKIVNANRLYSVISGINQLIVHTDNQEMLFNQACHVATELGKFDLAWIGGVDETDRTLHLLSHSNASPDDLALIRNIPYEKEGPVAMVLNTGTHYLLNDTQHLSAESTIKKLVEHQNFKSFIMLPVKRSGVIYATLNLFTYKTHVFDPDEILLLEEVAGDISFALDTFQKKVKAEQAEKRLKHSELRLKQAQSTAHLGSWELDFSVGLAVWSDEHCRIYGLSPSNNRHSFESWLSFIHPEDVDFVKAAIEGVGQSFNHASLHHRIVRPDGSIRHVHMNSQYETGANGEPIGLYGVSHDVTDSKLAENSLIQSEANLRLIMDLLPQKIYIKNLSGRYLFVNKSFANLYGMHPKEVINASRSGQHFMTENTENHNAEDRQVITDGEQRVITEQTFVGPSGEQKIFHVTKLPYYWGRAAEPGILGILNDITAEKYAESERNSLLADIVRRNESLEQFAYIISHNLRAPLANIQALSALLQMIKDDPAEEESLLSKLSMSALKLDQVVKDLHKILQTTHHAGEGKEKVKFSEICTEVRLSIADLFGGEAVEIKTDFSAAGEFYCVKSYLYSIFFNLISNSIKYRRPGVPLLIEIYSRSETDKVELVFKDNGLGMDLEKIGDQLFGLYKRFHTHVEGKGMGLYMVKRHVEIMGGRIELASKVNQGSTFTITI